MSPAMYTTRASHYDNAEHMMEVLGGSFVKSLVNLWYCADTANKKRVRDSFPEYFERYEQMFKEWSLNSSGGAA